MMVMMIIRKNEREHKGGSARHPGDHQERESIDNDNIPRRRETSGREGIGR